MLSLFYTRFAWILYVFILPWLWCDGDYDDDDDDGGGDDDDDCGDDDDDDDGDCDGHDVISTICGNTTRAQR